VAIAILAIAAGLSTIPAFGQQLPCPDCLDVDTRMLAEQSIIAQKAVYVTTDRTIYDSGSMITVMGTVHTNRPGTDVGLVVIGPPPFNNRITIEQLPVQADNTFSVTLSTAGELWKYDGTYTIRVTYGSQEIVDTTRITLTGGKIITPGKGVECGPNDIAASGQCVPFSISGGSVSSAMFSSASNSLIINISSFDDGMITVNPSTNAIRGIFMVLVDGEEWDDVEIIGNEVTVSFPAGTEEIEIIGTFAIPEFGTIAALILAIAIISIIAVTSKTRLNVIPKY